MSKLCFLISDVSWSGGTVRMTALLANEFCKTEEVHLLNLHCENEVSAELDLRIRQHVLSATTGKLGIIKQICEIRNYIKLNKIDWLINVDVGISIYGIPATKSTKTKVITWEHSNYFNNWNSRIFPYFRRFAAKHSDAVVVLTERDKENYQTNIKSKKPIYVIPNPAQQHRFQYNTESQIILSAGLLLPIKGFDKAIKVASKVLPKFPEWKWFICGEGPERGHLEKMISDAKLKKQVLLCGTVENMAEQYQKAAIYVMTSETEGLPMVLLEAKSWGLPIVSFDIMTGPCDIIRDGVNGYLVPQNDINIMAERLETLIESFELRCRFSENSQLDMDKFNFERIVEKWEKIMC